MSSIAVSSKTEAPPTYPNEPIDGIRWSDVRELFDINPYARNQLKGLAKARLQRELELLDGS